MNLEILNEVTSVAAKQVAVAISKLLKQYIEVNIIPISIIEGNGNEAVLLLREKNAKCVITTAEITGSVSGVALFSLSHSAAFSLCNILLHKKDGSTTSFGEMEQSSLLEIGNIIIGNFLTSLSTYSSLRNITHKNPIFFMNSKNKIPAIKNAKIYKENLTVRTSFILKQKKINGECIFLFDQRILDHE